MNSDFDLMNLLFSSAILESNGCKSQSCIRRYGQSIHSVSFPRTRATLELFNTKTSASVSSLKKSQTNRTYFHNLGLMSKVIISIKQVSRFKAGSWLKQLFMSIITMKIILNCEFNSSVSTKKKKIEKDSTNNTTEVCWGWRSWLKSLSTNKTP